MISIIIIARGRVGTQRIEERKKGEGRKEERNT